MLKEPADAPKFCSATIQAPKCYHLYEKDKEGEAVLWLSRHTQPESKTQLETDHSTSLSAFPPSSSSIFVPSFSVLWSPGIRSPAILPK